MTNVCLYQSCLLFWEFAKIVDDFYLHLVINLVLDIFTSSVQKKQKKQKLSFWGNKNIQF